MNINQALENLPDLCDINDMNDFLKGINSIGQLFPPPISYSDYPSQNSAWEGVEASFRQAGNDLRFAMKEYSDAKRESKQTP